MVQDDKGKWQLPGGRLNEGETVPECLKREIREELSLDIEPLSIFDTFLFKSASGANHFLVIYLVRVVGDATDLKRQETEINDMRWVAEEDVDSTPMWQEYQAVLRKFFKTGA